MRNLNITDIKSPAVIVYGVDYEGEFKSFTEQAKSNYENSIIAFPRLNEILKCELTPDKDDERKYEVSVEFISIKEKLVFVQVDTKKDFDCGPGDAALLIAAALSAAMTVCSVQGITDIYFNKKGFLNVGKEPLTWGKDIKRILSKIEKSQNRDFIIVE